MENLEIFTTETILILLGAKVKNLRISRELSQSELANIIGVDRVSITNIESGRHGMRYSLLLKLCVYCGVTPNDLLPTHEECVKGISSIKKIKSQKQLRQIEVLEARLAKLKEATNG